MRAKSITPDTTNERQVRQQTATLLAQATRNYGIPLPGIQLRFNLRGKTAGQVRINHHSFPLIRYNPAILEQHTEKFLANTVPHEVAHVICYLKHGLDIRPHGPEWQEVMAFFGVPARRCHDYDLSAIPTRHISRYHYRCACREHALSATRHHRVLRGQTYLCNVCKQPLQAVQPGE